MSSKLYLFTLLMHIPALMHILSVHVILKEIHYLPLQSLRFSRMPTFHDPNNYLR